MAPIDRRHALATLLSATVTTIASAQPRQLSLATFNVDVTPPVGHPCMGGGIAPIKEVVDPLQAIGIILLGDGAPIAIVAVDWCEIRNDAYDRWRDVIAEAIGTTRERVLVSALHQHDAPVADLAAQKLLSAAKAQGAICDLEFHEKTVQRVAKAAKSAVSSAVRVTHIGHGQAKVKEVASNRRYRDSDGKIHFNRMSATRDAKVRSAEEGLIDPFLKTLSFWNGETPVVAIHSYATHPMSFYGRGGASADFVGIARRLRQADAPQCVQIYVSGCSGNVTAGKYNDGSTENRAVLAKKIHAAMRDAWTNTVRKQIDHWQFRHAKLDLPVRTSKGFSPDELKTAIATPGRPFGQCLAALGLSWRNRVESGQPIDVVSIDFGSASYLLLPAEAYVEYQLYAQSLRPDAMVLTAGYGESGPGYIPTDLHWKEGDGNLSDWCWVDPGAEAKMKEAIAQVIGKK